MLSFSLKRTDRVRISVHDVSGRRVRTLVNRTLRAGEHAEGWDGRDDRGTPVATGVYLYRLTAGSQTLTRKAVLLK